MSGNAGFDPKTRHPDSAERNPEHERHVSMQRLTDRQVEVLSWMARFNRGVTSRCAMYDEFADIKSESYQVGSVMESLWSETDLVDRQPFLQEHEGNTPGRTMAHLYWLTPAGKAALSGL